MQLDKSNPKRILVDVENFKIVHGAYYEKSQKHYPIEDYVPPKDFFPYPSVKYSAFSDSNILMNHIPTGLNQVPSISNRIKLAIIACDHFSSEIKITHDIEETLFLLSMSIPKRGESYNNLLFGFASCSTEYSGELAISMTESLAEYLETYKYEEAPPIISAREFFKSITFTKGGLDTAAWNIPNHDDYSDEVIQETWKIIRSNLVDELNRIDGKTVNINSRPSQYFEMICAMSLGLFQVEWRNGAQVQQTMCGAQSNSIMKYVALKVPLKCVPKPSKPFLYQFCNHRHQQTRYGKRMLAYAYYARQLIDLQVIKLNKNDYNDTKNLLNSALLDRGMYHGMPLLKIIVMYAKFMKKTPLEFFETFYWEPYENAIDKLASDLSFLQTEYNLNQLMKVYNINWDDQNSMERINTTQLVIAKPFGYCFGRIFDDLTLGQFRADSNPNTYIFLALSYMRASGDKELLNTHAVQRFIVPYKNRVAIAVLKHSTYVINEVNMKTGQTINKPQKTKVVLKAPVKIKKPVDAAQERTKIALELTKKAELAILAKLEKQNKIQENKQE